nr:putative E3 ubiquitin-protein ligase RF298 [Ipomoea batatas]
MLRKEIQFEENIIKRRCELQDALSHLGAQIDAINSVHDEVMAERSKLMEGIAESRLNFVDSCIDLRKSKLREEELQKQPRTLEVEMSSLQGELAALKGNSADLPAKIDKARKCQSEFEGLWQREEREKTKLLEKAECIRRERQERKQKTKIEEEKLIAEGEENRVKYEEQMNKLSAEISAVKLGAVGESSSSGQGGLKREWECVMCLTEPNSVVFLPCAHQRNELQKESNLFECFEHMHKKKNGAFVDERSKRIAEEIQARHDVAMQEAEGSTKTPIINMSQLYVDVVGTKASSFISENSSSSSATSQFHQAAMKEMLNQQLESMQAEMDAKLQAERAQMQAQIASLMDELRCNGMLSTSMPRPPTTEAEHSINSNDENL